MPRNEPVRELHGPSVNCLNIDATNNDNRVLLELNRVLNTSPQTV